MMDITLLTSFLGWCTIINIGILVYSFVFITIFQEFTLKIHSKLMKVEATKLPTLYFNYLAFYKVIIIVFNIVPYLALKLLS